MVALVTYCSYNVAQHNIIGNSLDVRSGAMLVSSLQSDTARTAAASAIGDAHAIDSAAFESISAVLRSKQFETLHFQPYRGTDADVLRHLAMTDDFVARLAVADMNANFHLVIRAIDACMIDNLNVQEVRSVVRTIARRDVKLLQIMPRTRQMLLRALNSIELSDLMRTSRLRKITEDVARYQQHYFGDPA